MMEEDIKLFNYNLVLCKPDLNPNTVRDVIEDIVKDKTEESQPLTSSFPGIVLINVPPRDLSITIQNDAVAIADLSTTIGRTQADFIASIAIEVSKATDKYGLTMYGFNYVYTLQFNKSIDKHKACGLMNVEALKAAGLASDDDDLELLSFDIQDKESSTTIRQSVKTSSDKKGNNLINYGANVEFKTDVLPKLSELSKSILDYDTKLRGKLKSLHNYLGE